LKEIRLNKILVTGGCGFIGANWMDRLLARGARAVAFDNLSRRGAVKNAEWLRAKYGGRRDTGLLTRFLPRRFRRTPTSCSASSQGAHYGKKT